VESSLSWIIPHSKQDVRFIRRCARWVVLEYLSVTTSGVLITLDHITAVGYGNSRFLGRHRRLWICGGAVVRGTSTSGDCFACGRGSVSNDISVFFWNAPSGNPIGLPGRATQTLPTSVYIATALLSTQRDIRMTRISALKPWSVLILPSIWFSSNIPGEAATTAE
jgi:hypothetical protein